MVKELMMEIFRDVFLIEDDNEVNIMKRNYSIQWDSLMHMRLITEIEKRFNVLLTAGEIIEIDTFEKAIQVIKEKSVE